MRVAELDKGQVFKYAGDDPIELELYKGLKLKVLNHDIYKTLVQVEGTDERQLVDKDMLCTII